MAKDKLSMDLENMTIDELMALRDSLMNTKQKLNTLLKRMEEFNEEGERPEA